MAPSAQVEEEAKAIGHLLCLPERGHRLRRKNENHLTRSRRGSDLIVTSNPAGPISRFSPSCTSIECSWLGRLNDGNSADSCRRELSLSPIANLFWNAPEHRLRARWRLLVFFVVLLVVAVVEGRVRAGLAGRLPDLDEGIVRALVFALLIAALLYLAGRVLDHRRISDYGFHFSRQWWTDLGFGVLLGALLLFGVFAVGLAMGWVTVTGSFAPSPGQPFVATILVGVVAVAAVAFGEEASYRGYPIKNLAEGLAKARWGMVIAVVIPAVYFGLAHTTNENATWLSTFNIVIFGLLFGTGYVLTGELALSIGLHFGWDFVQGFVFGIVASGNNMGRCSSSPVTPPRSCGPAGLMEPRAGSWGRPPTLPASWQHSPGRDLSTAQPFRSPLSTPAVTPPVPDRRCDLFQGIPPKNTASSSNTRLSIFTRRNPPWAPSCALTSQFQRL
jgi:membrane protease YdiL (CAAX protease family)